MNLRYSTYSLVKHSHGPYIQRKSANQLDSTYITGRIRFTGWSVTTTSSGRQEFFQCVNCSLESRILATGASTFVGLFFGKYLVVYIYYTANTDATLDQPCLSLLSFLYFSALSTFFLCFLVSPFTPSPSTSVRGGAPYFPFFASFSFFYILIPLLSFSITYFALSCSTSSCAASSSPGVQGGGRVAKRR